jgi:acylphosphatase
LNFCVRLTVSGVVQGVGFRFFVNNLANSFNLFGYVKNLYSGDVEIEVEGEENILNAFIKEVKIGPRFAHIESLNIVKSEFTGKYNKFQIRH